MDTPATADPEAFGPAADTARRYRAILERNPDNAEVLYLSGLLHGRHGRPAEAAALLGRAARLRPDAPAYHTRLAEALGALGRHAEAAESARAALRLQPQSADAPAALGSALLALGRNGEAADAFRAAVAAKPDHAPAWNNLGCALQRLGRADQALHAYRAALDLSPGMALARANLGQLLVDQGQAEEGLRQCRAAARDQPKLAAAHVHLGNALRALRRADEACAAYGEALRLDPRCARAHLNLGVALQQRGEPARALQSFRRAAELAPADPETWQFLMNAQASGDDLAGARASAERLVELRPREPRRHCDLGWALQELGRRAEAAACYRQALELDPGHVETLIKQGGLHEELGELAEAEACYRRAGRADPRAPAPPAHLANLLRGKLPEADRVAALARLGDPSVRGWPRVNLLYGLAQVHDGRGEYAAAAAWLAEANALSLEQRRLQGLLYDPAEEARFVDRLVEAFTPARFARLAGAGDRTRAPVFVFGMPRSGTTLVEQVLASHPLAHGAGELRLGRAAFDAFADPPGAAAGLAARLDALEPPGVQRLVRGYLDGVAAVVARDRPGAAPPERVVDKMPDNFFFLGLLAVLFPNATFIHVRRDLRDVAVSCWMTLFRSLRWTNDPAHLASRAHAYRRLMDHWRAALPVRVHEVSYEGLVEDFEREAQRLVAACGLDWDPACARFHETSRPVRTASITQVRQPLYRKSVGRWKHYEEPLADLFARLPADEAASQPAPPRGQGTGTPASGR